MGEVVPVTLMTSADLPAPAPAVQAPAPTPAATETPVPQASPQPAAPQEAPTPAPPTPKTQPTPPIHAATPAKTQPTPPTHAATPAKAKPTPQPKEDWAALAASLEHQAQPAAARPSSAPRGPTRPAQAVQASLSSGVSNARSEAALASISNDLHNAWNANCGVPVGDLVIDVTFTLGPTGILEGKPQGAQASATDLPVKVAWERAARAVQLRNPFSDPAYAPLYGQNITVRFNQKKDCQPR
jgi:hypothetical protein